MDQAKNKKRILVTGVGGPAGVNVVRLLKNRTDVEVFGCDIDATSAGQSYVDKFLISPRVSDAKEYEKWTKETVEDNQIDLLIPTVDEELLPLSRFVDDLKTTVFLSPTKTLDIAADKLSTYKFASERLSQYNPRFVPLSEWTEDWKEGDVFFLKPRQGRGGRGCRMVTREELNWLKSHATSVDDYIVMENLSGVEWTVDAYIDQNGELAYLIPRERLGLSGGISIKGRTVKNEKVIKATKLLLEELLCSGPVCIQWKADSDGNPKFVEINPRLSGGLMISVAGGINPIDALMSELDKEIPSYQDWKEVTVVGCTDYQIINI